MPRPDAHEAFWQYMEEEAAEEVQCAEAGLIEATIALISS